MTILALDPLDLAALLCSRVCHDVISPVGAIINGLEVLDEEKDPETRAFAMDLVKKSATMASAKLQFCRLAFGAAGSAGASIDMGDAESVTRGLFGDEKLKLDWRAPRILMPKNKVKLILNLCLVAAAAVPRGGVVTVKVEGEGAAPGIRLEARGSYARLAHGVQALLSGTPEGGVIDGHGIQPFYAGLVARAVDMTVTVEAKPELVVIEARPNVASSQTDEGAIGTEGTDSGVVTASQ